MTNEIALKIASFYLEYGGIIWAALGVDMLARSVMLWDNLNRERGVDRVCWLIVLSIPFFGSIAYVLIALPQRSERIGGNLGNKSNGLKEPSTESLSWAARVLEKELKK